MKVAFNIYPSAFFTPGGGEVQLLMYKEYLQSKNIDIYLFNLWEHNFLDFHLVHFFSCMTGSVQFCSFVKEIGLPLVISPNLWITNDKKNEYPFNDIRNNFIIADKVIGNSNMECDLLAKVFNMPREKFASVNNGISEIFFKGADPNIFRMQYNISHRFVLNVANIEPRKNQISLARAMKNFPEMKLVIIGHERDRNYAKQLYREAGDQLIYLNAMPQDSEIFRSAYAACELFALPSSVETPGLAALEACAMGARILITSVGSTKEYFGDGVVYVNPDDEKDISNGIRNALTNPRNELMSLVMNANYTWPKVVENLSKIYSNVLSGDESIIRANPSIYPPEWDGERIFAWTKHKVSFSSLSGTLNLEWRSVCGASVDVFIGSELKFKNLKVSSEWSTFTLDIPNQLNDELSFISFQIKPEKFESDDTRELGLAISDMTHLQSINT